MDTYDAQRGYPSSLIQIFDPKQVAWGAGGHASSVTKRAAAPTRHVLKYLIKIGGKHVQVRKQYFGSLHGLSPQNSVTQ